MFALDPPDGTCFVLNKKGASCHERNEETNVARRVRPSLYP